MTVITLPDPCCILLVGPAGAGKSTFAARHFPTEAILSSDALRAAISGDAADQGASRAAFRALHRTLDRRLVAGQSAVIDATNVQAPARHAITRIAARHGVPVAALVFDLPAALVYRRNAARPGRTVPDAIVARQLAALRKTLDSGALAGEGYAQVVRLLDGEVGDRLVIRMGLTSPPAG